tara:strand:+ start:1867 stop:2304 length:438 start_codon:yes stop_codon:yes gene_type:complete
MIKIQVINLSPYELPKYQTDNAAGMDLRAFTDSKIKINSLDRKVINTGLKISLPKGFEAQIRPRSGLAAEHGISVLNSPGTIDSDYRGEIRVILVNLSTKSYLIKPGDRIAQIVISKHETIKWSLTEKLENSIRDDKGFGSTGKN